MFKNSNVFSSYSVNDLSAAKRFYGQTLELQVSESAEGLELKFANGSSVFLYPKPNHSPATFTVLNFIVDNIDSAVEELRSRDVTFEHYEGAIKTDEKGIHRNSGPKIAWFKDPAGNILAVLQPR